MRILLAILFTVFCAPLWAAGDKVPPNFIVILLDDLGLHDAGFMGNDFIETPAIDKLANDGIVFTQAYANAPNCAPSRAAILSGQYAPRTGVYTMMSGDVGDAQARKVLTPKNSLHLPEQVYTLAELLRDHGYATAHIGKWNLGTGPVRGPEGQGFALNIGGHRGGVGQSHYAPYSADLPGLADAPAGEYLTDRLNHEALRFVQAHKQQPFFLYLSHYAPHFPLQAPATTKAKYEAKRRAQCSKPPALRYCDMSGLYPEYAAMVEHIDRGVAALRDLLHREQLADNTVIVLLSDNGGYALAHDPQALRGRKSQLYEGGIRVPMVWLVPGALAGRQVAVPVSGIDLYPTFAALAGINVGRQVLDGNDLSPLLFGHTPFPSRALYWYFPAYTQDSDVEDLAQPAATQQRDFSQRPAAVIQRDGWKLIRYYDGSAPELYYLPDDPLEQRDRHASDKARTAKLLRELEQWLQRTGGAVSLPANPAYSPAGQ